MNKEKVPVTLDEIPSEWRDSVRQSKEAVFIENVTEITDDDFRLFGRSLLLQGPAKSLCDAIGIVEKRILLKRGVLAKNAIRHPDLSPDDSRQILNNALYSPNKYGKNRPVTKPTYWVAIKSSSISSLVVIEVSETKEFIEIVGWRYANEKTWHNWKGKRNVRAANSSSCFPKATWQQAFLLFRPTWCCKNNAFFHKKQGKTEKTPHAHQAIRVF